MPMSQILCVKCGAILSTDYENDRGREETALYTHKCYGLGVKTLTLEDAIREALQHRGQPN